MKKKVFVIGGTGVMGTYLTRQLLDLGYAVDAATRHDKVSDNPDLNYVKADFTNLRVITDYLSGRHYDAIVDFMTYTTAMFAERYELLLSSTDQFIFLSSYRAYSDLEIPTVETSPRLLDVVDDMEFLTSEDYSLFKSREENILRSSKFTNWTIVRPAITYSSQRIAFVTLELSLMLSRAKAGKPIYIPQECYDIPATCTWAGDVARMIALLVGNDKAFCEAFSVCTAENQTWGTIAGYYKELIGADIRPVPIQDYLDFFGNKPVSRWMLIYDRCMKRVMDNSKILAATGIKQEELTGIRDGIAKCIAEVPEDKVWTKYTLPSVDAAMDEYAARH